jgi:hypothetical protein
LTEILIMPEPQARALCIGECPSNSPFLKNNGALVSLHFLKTMGLGPFGASAPLFLRNGELLGHSPIHNALACGSGIINISVNKKSVYSI